MTRARTLWEEGHQPGGRVVAWAAALLLLVLAVDLGLGGRVGVLFDVVFVLLSLAAALLVRPRDFFAVGVLPPLLMLGAFVLTTVVRRDGLSGPDDGPVQAVVSGLAHHSLALGLGYALCLAVLVVRSRRLRRTDLLAATTPPAPG